MSAIKTFCQAATQTVAITTLIGAIATAPFLPSRAEALTEAQALERLGTIPVFTVTDEKGLPVLGTLPKRANAKPEDPQQLLLFFFNPDDAKELLGELKKLNPAIGTKAKIVVQPMTRAYQVIQQNKDKKVAFQFVPSRTSLESARTLLSAQGVAADRIPALPVFYAMGGEGNNRGLLTIEQNGQQVIPFFFEQKDLQGLIDNAKQQQPNTVKATKIEVTSLLNVLGAMVTQNNKPNPDAERFQFIPSLIAVEYVVNLQGAPTSGQIPPTTKPATTKPATTAPAAKPTPPPTRR